MLKRSRVHRRLDAKFKIGGMEAVDLLSVLFLAAIMNLFFGRTRIAPLMIFVPSSVLFFALYWGKRGKPDGYLKEGLNYYLSSGELHAGERENL